MASAATRPPTESETGKPTRSGAVSGVPVMLIIPDRPWMIWSYAGAWLIGPVWPKPEMAQ